MQSGGAFAAHTIGRGTAGKGMGVGVYDGEAGSGMGFASAEDFCQRYVCAHHEAADRELYVPECGCDQIQGYAAVK